MSVDAAPALGPFKAVVLDIEGTTTPLSFVHDVLFPYVLNNIESFLDDHWSEPECQEKIAALYEQSVQDVVGGVEGAVSIVAPTESDAGVRKASVVANVAWQMRADRKIAALKAFQGYMWRAAYASGAVRGVVYPDVVAALALYRSRGIPVFIYSSGSVEAQKLLFKHSDKGDLLDSFAGHFDTAIGPKTVAESYSKLAAEIAVAPNHILFVSDNVKELEAAVSVGFQVRLAMREGNHPVTAEDQIKYGTTSSFDKLIPADVDADLNANGNAEASVAQPVIIETSAEKRRKTDADAEFSANAMDADANFAAAPAPAVPAAADDASAVTSGTA